MWNVKKKKKDHRCSRRSLPSSSILFKCTVSFCFPLLLWKGCTLCASHVTYPFQCWFRQISIKYIQEKWHKYLLEHRHFTFTWNQALVQPQGGSSSFSLRCCSPPADCPYCSLVNVSMLATVWHIFFLKCSNKIFKGLVALSYYFELLKKWQRAHNKCPPSLCCRATT